ncbi:RNA 2',3'-cyclic phosphodiesterase [Janibacter melonis]|uniref:RNA 2',3'-cyclic phosphodiesterase n=1 Tax=Janibacter melonis TaxID=262209 RepID=UPI001E65182D|nr:RNA 2',3'-cyclic phosphodiesterase [Janibacter melonis]MCB5993024.1 RNA 2',3'-cyclic phosphodiesterase [Janibacter melonis]
MGHLMFVAVALPEAVREDLAAFLEPREGMPWVDAVQWHLTLAFMASVPPARADELVERLAHAAGRVVPFALSLGGAGAFPHAGRASVLWLGVDDAAQDPLARLARGCRAAASVSGASPDGRAFVPHLTLARLRRPVEATRWLRVLDAWQADPFVVDEVELVASFLGEGANGRPRHEVVATLPLGADPLPPGEALREG